MSSMITMPTNMPSALPSGPASDRYRFVVNTKEPHPMAVPTDNAQAPSGVRYGTRPSSRSLTEPNSSIIETSTVPRNIAAYIISAYVYRNTD